MSKRIQTGTGFSEAITQQYEAVNAAEAARRAGDAAEMERQQQRADNANEAAKEYTRDTYGS
ncbi:hypothetical protein [Streptomyces sp. CFMR 7]|uniref:hypothetical protein n=1 Tax=Streptomyces sp. CFMR 7 TaxID=1649184 RepID=UPI00119CB708|nr:hypothetical protein [Streptomyces sp. CFMR 7]